MNDEIDEPSDSPIEPEEGETVETPDESNIPPNEPEEPDPEVDIEKLQATNKKLFERAKKAEAALKASKISPKSVDVKQASSQSVEETVLLANGMSDELMGELKAVAAVRKTSLIKAQNDPIFVAVKEKFEKDNKSKKASLGVSRGSGSVTPKKDFTTPGLSREEHMKMVKETV